MAKKHNGPQGEGVNDAPFENIRDANGPQPEALRREPELHAEEIAAAKALPYEDAIRALDKGDPAVLAAATEYVLNYSEKATELLREGKDYLNLLSAKAEDSGVERAAKEIVLEILEDELHDDDV